MPVSVVVGGQYGSEGKGKVAYHLANEDPDVEIVVRPGGTNSGHTVISDDGLPIALRQLPAASISARPHVVIPSGAYVDVELLLKEMSRTGLSANRLTISPYAHVITEAQKKAEHDEGLTTSIGSTGSGTGAAVRDRVARRPSLSGGHQAMDDERLQPFVDDPLDMMRSVLERGRRILVEGTQGFGLSPLHGGAWPKATSRDTTAASFVAETGLSPRDVDRVIMVLRTFPIRVAGSSGPLLNETTWNAIADEAGIGRDLTERTTVTKKIRRVGRFDAGIVRRAIAVNRPSEIVLNHVDYIDGRDAREVAREWLGEAGLLKDG